MECNIKTIFLGDMGVGKTTFFECFVVNFDQARLGRERHASTIGVDFKKPTFKIGNVDCVVTMWDTAGQERFRAITRQFYRGSHIAYVLVSVPDLILCIKEKAEASRVALKGGVHVQPDDAKLSDYDIVKRALQPYYSGLAIEGASNCIVFTILNKMDLVDPDENIEPILLHINKVIGENVADLPKLRSPLQISCGTFLGMKKVEVEFKSALEQFTNESEHLRTKQKPIFLEQPAPQQGCYC